jgi:acyl-CoA thioesterase
MEPNDTTKQSSHGLENYQYPDKFGEWLGYKVIRLDREEFSADVELQIREDHLSPARRVHGGVVSAFFDFACGAAVFSSLSAKDFCSTIELKVNYLQPFHLGDLIRANAKVVYRGNRLCVLHALAYRNDDKTPAAMATATFNVVSTKSISK